MKLLARIFLLIIVILTIFANSLYANDKNTFLDFKLGSSEDEFNKNYPNAISDDDNVLMFTFSKIKGNSIKFYDLKEKKVTTSGNSVSIYPGFFNGKLAIIYVEYDYVSVDDLFNAFNKKYGKPTDSSEDEFNNFLVPNGEGSHEKVQNIYFENKAVIADLNYTPRIKLVKVIFADKKSQTTIRALAKKKKDKKIDGLLN